MSPNYSGELIGDDGSKLVIQNATYIAPPVVVVPQVNKNLPVAVSVGTVKRNITVNQPRMSNGLVLYSSSWGSTTGTNIYGAEATLDRDGVVLSINQQLSTRLASAIPANGYVLSGHAAPVTDSAYNFVMSLKVGTKVVLLDASNNPTSWNEQVTAQSRTGKKVVAAYWQMYQGPLLESIPPGYTHHIAAFATNSNNVPSGSLVWAPYFEPTLSFAAAMKMRRDRYGEKFLVSLGGGGQSAVLNNEQDANATFVTVSGIIAKHGFDGVDFDYENNPNPSAVVSVIRQLTAWKPGLYISLAPRPYEDFYFDIAAQVKDVLGHMFLQFYDFNGDASTGGKGTRDAAWLRSWVTSRVDAAKAAGVPYEKIVLGCITYPQYPYGWNTVEVYRSIFDDLDKTRNLGGVGIWESSLDLKDNWHFVNNMKTLNS